jgi:hypothetical protein
MALHTASEGISFARELETASGEYYERLAERFPDHAETFASYATANKKWVAHVERAYYGVITDAIEGCYAFNLEPDEFVLDLELGDDADLGAAVGKAVQNEETIHRYYTQAAEQSKGTMADVPRAFMFVAKKRGRRIEELREQAAR